VETSQLSGLSTDELRELRHEVRNALTSALGYTDYLLRRLGDRVEACEQQALLTIRESLRRADSLLGTSDGPTVAVRCDLREIIRGAVGQLPPERSDDLRLEVPTDGALVGRWNRDRVEEVLANLLSNAAKYSAVGTPIAIELRRVGYCVRVRIKDAGIGIDREDLEAIFHGHRTELARLTAPGSGLGLRVSRRLAEAERGRLWASSSPGEGSAFYLELPLSGTSNLDSLHYRAPA
jgi:signal transduction histidine kinase